MDIISRMKQYMEHCKLTNSQFADAAGIPRPTLSQLLNGRNKSNEGAKKISSDIVRKLHDAFPTLNVMWLLFGDGDMETGANIKISEPENSSNPDNIDTENSGYQDIQRQILFDEDLPEFESENQFEPATHQQQSKSKQTTFQSIQAATHTTRHINPAVSLQPDKTKKVQSIMVFYSDNSFEIFKPAE